MGDDSKFKATTEAVGGRLRGFGKEAEAEGRRAGEGFDRAAEGADNAEGKAQGFASTLTGTKDVMSATGEIARGNYFEGFVLAGQGAADLAEGLNYTVIPAVKAAATAFTRQGIATVRDTAAKVTNAVVSKAAAVATWAMTVAQRALNLAMSANPIGLIITVVVLVVAALVRWYMTSQRARDIINGVFRAIVGAGRSLWNGLQAAFSGIRSAFGAVASFVASAARSGFLGPVAWIIANWGRVVSFFRELPGRIRGFLSGLPGQLLAMGQRIVQGLIDGIMSKIAAVGNAIGSVASKIRNALPFSPAKEGPLSGRGDPFLAGRNIADLLARGIRASAGDVRGAMFGALQPPAAAAAGGPSIVVNARTNADPSEIAREVAWTMRTSGR